MSHPRISIVTASFNQAAFIERTILSVLSQNYPNLEYIVIDGGSTDGSVDIIKKYADKLAYWCTEPDQGQYYAINKGFSKSTGEIMGFLNSDDVYLPWTFSTISSIFSSLAEVNWLTSLSPFVMNSEGAVVASGKMSPLSKKAFINGLYIPGAEPNFGCIVQEGTFWKRQLWQEAGGRMDTHYKLAGDFDLWARFGEHDELYCLGDPLASMTRHGKQRSNDLVKYTEECRASLHKLRQRLHLEAGQNGFITRLAPILRRNSLLWSIGRRFLSYTTLVIDPVFRTDDYSLSWRVKKLRIY